jgi:hypothetical protein
MIFNLRRGNHEKNSIVPDGLTNAFSVLYGGDFVLSLIDAALRDPVGIPKGHSITPFQYKISRHDFAAKSHDLKRGEELRGWSEGGKQGRVCLNMRRSGFFKEGLE